MVFTNYAKQAVTFLIGSDISLFVGFTGIGSGSGTVAADDTTLKSEVNRVAITGSPDFSVGQKVGFQADFNSIVMSGITLTEFGIFDTGSATGFTGSAWQREAFGSIVFDGTNELQILTTLEVL